MQKVLGETDLYALRLDSIIQYGEKVGDRLIRRVRPCSKSKCLVGRRLLTGLLDQVAHILFQQTNHMPREMHT